MNQPKFRRIIQILTYVALVIVVLIAARAIGSPTRDTIKELNYSELLSLVENDQLAYVMTSGNSMIGATVDSGITAKEFGTRYNVTALLPSVTQFYSDVNAIYGEKLGKDPDQVKVTDYDFEIQVQNPAGTPWWLEWLPFIIMIALFAVFWIFIMRQQNGANRGVMSFSKSHAKMADPEICKGGGAEALMREHTRAKEALDDLYDEWTDAAALMEEE